MKYKIFTDGSFTQSDARFGMGFLIPDLELVAANKEATKLIPYGYTIDMSLMSPELLKSRNIVGEVFACMMAIQLMKMANPSCEIEVNHDYLGVAKWLTGEWQANKDLTLMYVCWFNWNGIAKSITFNHTPAHTTIEGNNLADMYARSGSNGIVQPRIETKDINNKTICNLVFRTEDKEVRCGFSY